MNSQDTTATITAELAWKEALPHINIPNQYFNGWLRIVTLDELLGVFEKLRVHASRMGLDPLDPGAHAQSYVSSACKRIRKGRDPEYLTFRERQALQSQVLAPQASQSQVVLDDPFAAQELSVAFGAGPYGGHVEPAKAPEPRPKLPAPSERWRQSWGVENA